MTDKEEAFGRINNRTLQHEDSKAKSRKEHEQDFAVELPFKLCEKFVKRQEM